MAVPARALRRDPPGPAQGIEGEAHPFPTHPLSSVRRPGSATKKFAPGCLRGEWCRRPDLNRAY